LRLTATFAPRFCCRRTAGKRHPGIGSCAPYRTTNRTRNRVRRPNARTYWICRTIRSDGERGCYSWHTKTLPFDQAIDWARAAEQFITGSAPEARSFTTNPGFQRGLPGSRRGRIRDSVLELIKAERAGLSRGEILERLHIKGNKAGETSVSNALTALLKREQIVRRERKYRVE